MELSALQERAIRASEASQQAERLDPEPTRLPAERSSAQDVQISEEARRLAETRAEVRQQERAAERDERTLPDEAQSTLAVRFGPAPLALRPATSGGIDSALRDALQERSRLPSVRQLLHEDQAQPKVDTRPAEARGDEPEPLPLLGADDEAEEVDLFGDGKPARSDDARAASDALPELNVREPFRGSVEKEPDAFTLPGSRDSEEARAETSGEAHQVRETLELERGTEDADLNAASTNVPASGAAQNAKSEQLNRAELPAAGGDEAEAAEQLERASASHVAPIEATREDSIVSRFLDRGPTAEPPA